MLKSADVKNQLDHLFRHEYARWIAILTAKYGTSNIDIIEDSVQEALYKAMRLWPFGQIPENPSAWLYKTASNQIIDVLRRNSKTAADAAIIDEGTINGFSEGLIRDEQVKMIFACCHPAHSELDQLLLNLKLNFAFGNAEVGKLLYKSPEAVKKAFTRAKKRFRDNVSSLELPGEHSLHGRLDRVTKVIYLIFTTGYNTFTGNALNKDSCEEALRIASYIDKKEQLSTPSLKALIALMCYKMSRFAARLDEDGNLMTLKEQNRELWDRELINIGNRYLMQASKGEHIHHYHLEAAIEHDYCNAPTFEDTDWNAILNYYDVLLKINPSPSVKLNRVVVLEIAKSPQSAMKALNELNSEEFAGNHLFYSIKGRLEKRLKKKSYRDTLIKAAELAPSDIEKEHLRALLTS